MEIRRHESTYRRMNTKIVVDGTRSEKMVKSSGGMGILGEIKLNESALTINIWQEKLRKVHCQAEYSSREAEHKHWSLV